MEKITFKGLDYYPVVSETGRVWLDRNLGATRVAKSLDDQAAYGEYFAFDEIECPEGWRLPTEEEWKDEVKTWNDRNIHGAFGSRLKLCAAGYRNYYDGELYNRRLSGSYRSKQEIDLYLANSWHLYINNRYAYITNGVPQFGFSVRLIKNI